MLELKIRIRGSELNQTDPFRCDASVENIAAGNYGPRHATTLKFFRSCILYYTKKIEMPLIMCARGMPAVVQQRVAQCSICHMLSPFPLGWSIHVKARGLTLCHVARFRAIDNFSMCKVQRTITMILVGLINVHLYRF